MKVVVALRASNPNQARQFLAEQQCEIHKSRFEAQEPALRNLIDGLYQQGLAIELQGASLAWFLIEADLTPKQWLAQSSVAICFSFDWFKQQTTLIRYLKGIAYCDAAASWAKLLPINRRPASAVQSEGVLDWQGLDRVQASEQSADGSHLTVKVEQRSAPLSADLGVDGSAVADNAIVAEGSIAAEGFVSAEDAIAAEGSVNLENTAKHAQMIDASVSAPSKTKRHSARKIITKSIAARKNIAQVKPKAQAKPKAQSSAIDCVGEPAGVEVQAVAEPLSAPAAVDVPVVKKRGRPRKNTVLELPAVSKEVGSDVDQASTAIPVQVSVNLQTSGGEETLAPKKRGRPRKVVATVTSEIDEEQLDLFV